jgi:carbon monoxide dehydrogenase subunit G
MTISDSRKWKVNRPPDEVLKLLTNMLTQKKAQLRDASSRRIEATMGSGLKTRLIGGLLVSKETLPVKITILLNEVGAETEIDATIQDNLGFGIKTGMVGRYREYIQSLFNELSRALQGP